ncbi:MAG TPA: guanylate kinase [Verrucomicrobiales bacterium]|nr:guanylate kinase [Verrucomicrobiales bacterium]
MTNPKASTQLLIVLSAPSGAGKTTLCQELLASRTGFTRAVTCTTRTPRQGEQDGVDYHFLDAATFEKKIAAGEFLEHATVYTNRYGTLKSEVLGRLREGRDVLLTVDVQGAASIQAEARRDPEMAAALVTVFLTPQTLSELERRLQKRNQNTPADAAKRLGEARREIARWGEFEYLIISTSIAEDVRRMLAIVDAEKMRASRSAAPEL